MIIVGGRLFKHSVVAAGAVAHEAIGRVSADLFFLGVTGIHPTAGLTTGDADEAAIKRAWSERSAETYVLGSSEKIGAASPFEVVPLSAITAVITDSEADPRGVAELRARPASTYSVSASANARDSTSKSAFPPVWITATRLPAT